MYKKGSRANWDPVHRKYVQGLISMKKHVNDRYRMHDDELKRINEEFGDDDEVFNETTKMGGTTTAGATKGQENHAKKSRYQKVSEIEYDPSDIQGYFERYSQKKELEEKDQEEQQKNGQNA